LILIVTLPLNFDSCSNFFKLNSDYQEHMTKYNTLELHDKLQFTHFWNTFDKKWLFTERTKKDTAYIISKLDSDLRDILISRRKNYEVKNGSLVLNKYKSNLELIEDNLLDPLCYFSNTMCVAAIASKVTRGKTDEAIEYA
jgi:hypothetical protein